MDLYKYIEFSEWYHWFFEILRDNGYIDNQYNFDRMVDVNFGVKLPIFNLPVFNKDYPHSHPERLEMLERIRAELKRLIKNIKINFPDDLIREVL